MPVRISISAWKLKNRNAHAGISEFAEAMKNGNKKAKYRCYQRKEDDLLEDIDLNELM